MSITTISDAELSGEVHAFPHIHVENGFIKIAGGLTKREAFAMAAMQGYCANPHFISSLEEQVAGPANQRETLANTAVKQADALLLALILPGNAKVAPAPNPHGE